MQRAWPDKANVLTSLCDETSYTFLLTKWDYIEKKDHVLSLACKLSHVTFLKIIRFYKYDLIVKSIILPFNKEAKLKIYEEFIQPFKYVQFLWYDRQ